MNSAQKKHELESHNFDNDTFEKLEETFHQEFAPKSDDSFDDFDALDNLDDIDEDKTPQEAAFLVDDPKKEQKSSIQSTQDVATTQVKDKVESKQENNRDEVLSSVQKHSQSSKLSGKTQSFLAIAVLMSIGSVGFSMINQSDISAKFGVTTSAVNDLEATTLSVQDRQLAIQNSVKELLLSNDNLKRTLNNNSRTLESVRVTISDLQSKVENNSVALASQQEALFGLNERMASLDDLVISVKTDVSKSTQSVNDLKKTVNLRQQRQTSEPVYNHSNAIKNATLESIDSWNNQTFVNLRESGGKWVSLQEGDKYQGWTVSGIREHQVTFTRNGQNKILTVKG